ncbi:hypothetical protein EDD37DRAFT_311647 [Exophiala viscosa]|uniref:Ras-associating domain-containing protein n=1 Tax=Exophiala viscosa TaxID=2486360 RepID=A0AAN6ICM9_9EURO|nr:hypothetical protein EDD36DRAFT_437233 [Exophiala viscosa]KAI1625650.1 hypothetical protein EDD37DRAFT_311647 [Exophiala viscosa]
MEGDGPVAPVPPSQVQKFMRYRSVRRSAAKEHEPSNPPPMPQASQTTLTRLPSRYRRSSKSAAEGTPLPNAPQTTGATHHASAPVVDAQPHSTTDNSTDDEYVKVGSTRGRRMVIGNNAQVSYSQSRNPLERSEQRPRTEDEQIRRSLEIAREEARLILEGEDDRVRALRRAETERRRTQREVRQESDQPKSRTLVIGRYTPSDQERGHIHASSNVEPPHKPAVSHSRSISVGKAAKSLPVTATSDVAPYDVPMSAVNAGSRRIRIRYKDSSLTIPITPSSTCRDVLNCVARHVHEPINVQTAVLVESFSQLGLERPIRRYERIRDILNSWDSDERNDLVIKAESAYTSLDLRESGAPSQQPVGGTVQMYYSQKPGRWDKRWIQVRNDGQVMISKNGTDSTNICHLSDFDLYDPTEAQIKILKPPRKMCFALKSQQKPSLFLEGANYVHFFSSKDQAIVLPWYHAVHAWRNWYLFNLVGYKEPTPPSAGSSSSRPSTSRSKESIPTVPHSVRPLLEDVGRPSQGDGSRPLIEFTPKKSITGSNPPTSPKHSKTNSAPPSAFTRGLLEGAVRPGSSDSFEGRGFTGTGLLARSASRRAAPADGKPLIDLQPTSEFTDGSLLRRLEAIAGPQVQPSHKIDRQKEGREITIPVGEGFD